MDETKLQLLVDQMEISDTIIRFASALDLQDWELCRSCFTDEIEADYSDLRGTPPTTMTADEFVTLRREGLSGLKTQHLSTNHAISVDGDCATCISYMLIYRFLPTERGDNSFDTHAYYTHTLMRTPQGWKICKVKQSVFWSRGAPQLHGALRK